MSGVIAAVWIGVILVRIIIRVRSGPGAKRVINWPLICAFLILISSVTASIFIFPFDSLLDAFILSVFCLLWLPSIWLALPIRLGLIRSSYYLSFLLLLRNSESLRAGAAFNALRALGNASGLSSDQREQWRHWVQSKGCDQASRASSGALMLWLMMEFDRDPERYLRPLISMYHLKVGTASHAMARAAFARLMAYSLARADWSMVADITHRWRSKWRLPLSRLIEICYHRQNGTARVSPLAYWYVWTRCGRPDWVSQLPRAQFAGAADASSAWPDVKMALVSATLAGHSVRLDHDSHSVLSEEWYGQWYDRATALHCADPGGSVDGLRQGVIAAFSRFDGEATAASEDVDAAFTRLRYLSHAICSRQEGGRLQSGLLEFQEWLNLFEVYDYLTRDESQLIEAFSIVEYTVWNWMADLWNLHGERSLAYYICSYMHPYAVKCGSESRSVYRDIMTGAVS